ncbi:MAG: PTS sugar transporter subunit IIA [Acidobacteriota bacterium]
MVKTLILTHGGLATELLKAARTIVGELGPDFEAVTLEWDDSFEVALEKAKQALKRMSSTNGTLILTDMYGGTPYNVASSLRDPGKIEVVTGVNLPMVVRLGCPGATERSLEGLATWIQKKAKGSIRRAGEGNGSNPLEGAKCEDDRKRG